MCRDPADRHPRSAFVERRAKQALQVVRRAFRTFPFADATRRPDSALGVDVMVNKRPQRDESAFLTALATGGCAGRTCL